MTFIRTKKIKKKEYAYLVESNWDPETKRPRQTVKNYLGLCVRLKDIEALPQLEQAPNFQGMVRTLFCALLEQNGFIPSDGKMIREEIVVDLNQGTVLQKKRPCVLKSWDGYVCNLTLHAVLQFKPEGIEEEAGRDLAHALRDAGLKVSPEIFIALFEMVYREI